MDEMAKRWADRLKNKKDYHGLAAYLCSYRYESDVDLWNAKNRYALRALREAGAEAVDAMLSEMDTGESKDDRVADVLIEIGDPKAVPLLKKLLDRGVWDAFGLTNDRVRTFVDKYPQHNGEVEKAACAICDSDETGGMAMDRSLEDLRADIRRLDREIVRWADTSRGDPGQLMSDIESLLRGLAHRESQNAKPLIEEIRGRAGHCMLELHVLCTELLEKINAGTAGVPISQKRPMGRTGQSDGVSSSPSNNAEKAGRHRVSVMFSVRVPEESDDVYMASSFNGWNPAGTCLQRFDARERILCASTTVDLLEGEAVEYKYTRGLWQTVEATADRGGVPNRSLEVLYRRDGSMEVSDTVDGWKDTRLLSYGPDGVSIASPDKAIQALFDALSTREDVLLDRCEHCHTKYPVKRRGSMMHIRSILQKRLESYRSVRLFRLEDVNLREAMLVVWFPEHCTMFSLCRSGDTFLACGPEDWDEIS